MTNQLKLAEQFRLLHEDDEAFILPNPWDAGSARILEGLGFKALATTSSGFAQSLGALDGSVTLEETLRHCEALVAATDIPVSADLERGYADDPEQAAQSIRRVAEVGVVGASIEDYSGSGIYEFQLAVERVQAAAEMAHGMDFPFMLTARAENLLHNRNDLDDTIRRLQAFAEVGADVVYAPGLKSLTEVQTVVQAVSKPVNVLAPFIPGVTLAELADAGVKRISIGGALANAAIGTTIRAAREMLETGGFGWLAGMAGRSDIEELLG